MRMLPRFASSGYMLPHAWNIIIHRAKCPNIISFSQYLLAFQLQVAENCRRGEYAYRDFAWFRPFPRHRMMFIYFGLIIDQIQASLRDFLQCRRQWPFSPFSFTPAWEWRINIGADYNSEVHFDALLMQPDMLIALLFFDSGKLSAAADMSVCLAKAPDPPRL